MTIHSATIRSFFILGMALSVGFAQAPSPLPGGFEPLPSIGRAAPDPIFDGAPSLGLADLKGRTVVVEFFSPACPGCAAMQEKTNALVEASDADKVSYLFIAEATAEQVQRYEKRHPISSRIRVVLDADGSITRAYGAARTPLSFVLDRKGAIAAITHPHFVDAAVLEAVGAGQKVDLRYFAPQRHADIHWEKRHGIDLSAPVGPALLRESIADISEIMHRPDGRFSGDGVTWAQFLALAFGTHADRVTIEDETLANKRISFLITSAQADDATTRKHLQALARKHLGDRLAVSNVTIEGLVLEAIREEAPPRVRGRISPISRWHEGKASMEGVTPASLAGRFAAFEFGRKFEEGIDATGWVGRYAIDLAFEPGNLASINASLATYGMKLTEGEVVRKRITVSR